MKAPVVIVPHAPTSRGPGTGPHVVSDSDAAQDNAQQLEVWVHGVGVIGRQLVDSPARLAQRWAGKSVSEMLADWSSHARNPMCVYVHHKTTSTFLIIPDPLGSALTFYYRGREQTYVSSSIPSLVEVAQSRGERMRKSLAYAIEQSSIANGGLTHASYEGVARLDVLEYMEIRDGNLQARKLPAFDFIYGPSRSQAELLEMVRQDALDSAEATLQFPAEIRVAHLTSGLDSRLVLGALMWGQRVDSFLIHAAGPRGTQDRDIADGLSATLGLRRTHLPGLRVAQAASVDELTVAPLRNSGGISRQGPLGREQRRSAVVLGGLHGELLRSFYSGKVPDFDPEDFDGYGVCSGLWGQGIFPTSENGNALLSSDFRGQVARRLSREISSIVALGVHSDAVLDHVYVSVRNRYHAGVIGLAWSEYGVRIDPLYSLASFKLGLETPLMLRSTSALSFDLMNSLHPSLSRYPFAEERFGGDLRKIRRVSPTLQFSGGQPIFASSDMDSSPAPVSLSAQDKERRARDIQKARELGAPYWQVAYLDEVQAELDRLIDSAGWHELSSYYNIKRLRWLRKNALNHRAYVRTMHDLYASLKWYLTD